MNDRDFPAFALIASGTLLIIGMIMLNHSGRIEELEARYSKVVVGCTHRQTVMTPEGTAISVCADLR